jgi:hypothetical protein
MANNIAPLPSKLILKVMAEGRRGLVVVLVIPSHTTSFVILGKSLFFNCLVLWLFEIWDETWNRDSLWACTSPHFLVGLYQPTLPCGLVPAHTSLWACTSPHFLVGLYQPTLPCGLVPAFFYGRDRPRPSNFFTGIFGRGTIYPFPDLHWRWCPFPNLPYSDFAISPMAYGMKWTIPACPNVPPKQCSPQILS